jgi:hypothetical protein
VPVHGVRAENRFAVMAAHDSRSPRSTVEGPPDRVNAGSADVELAVRVRLAFLEWLWSVMIHDVHGNLSFRIGAGMPDDERAVQGDKKIPTPLETLRLDKTAFSVVSLREADAADKAYWTAQSPRARLEAPEFMRQVAYGYDPLTARLERVLEVIKRPSC